MILNINITKKLSKLAHPNLRQNRDNLFRRILIGHDYADKEYNIHLAIGPSRVSHLWVDWASDFQVNFCSSGSCRSIGWNAW